MADTSVPLGPWRAASKVLRRFAPTFFQQKARIAWAYSAGFLASALLVAVPWPLKFIIDNVLLGQQLPGVMGRWTIGVEPTILVLALALAAAVISAAAAAASATEKIANARLRETMTLALRRQSLDHVLGLSILDRQADRTGEISLRMVDDTGYVARLFCKSLPLVFRHVVTTALTLIAMLWLSVPMGILGLAILVWLAVLVRTAAPMLQAASRGKRRLEGRVAGLAQEILRALSFVQATGGEQVVAKRFTAVNMESLTAGVAETRTSVVLERAMQVANGVALAAVVAGGGWLVLHHELSIGALTVCVAYLNQLLKPIEKINELASSVTGGVVRGERLIQLLERPTGLKAGVIEDTPERSRGEVSIETVSFSYRDDDGGTMEVLSDADLALKPGECVVVEGPSGAGKSTLLSLLLRLFDPDAGTMRLDGIAYENWPVPILREQFAIVLQYPNLFSGTVRETLLFRSADVDDDILWSALAKVALSSFIETLPKGLDAELGEDGCNLSGGQRVRLALARALIADRPVLILDEPFASVDPDSRDSILNALAAERGKRTIVVVTHQPLPDGFADRTIRLEHGRLNDIGDPIPLQPRKRAAL